MGKAARGNPLAAFLLPRSSGAAPAVPQMQSIPQLLREKKACNGEEISAFFRMIRSVFRMIRSESIPRQTIRPPFSEGLSQALPLVRQCCLLVVSPVAAPDLPAKCPISLMAGFSTATNLEPGENPAFWEDSFSTTCDLLCRYHQHQRPPRKEAHVQSPHAG